MTCMHGFKRAALGGFIEDTTNKTVYGITCKHVTDAADGLFFICETFCNTRKLFARKKINIADARMIHDIDIIQLDKAFHDLCRPVYKNKQGKSCHSRLYNGTVKDLYGKQVFQCQVDDTASIRNIIKIGTIPSKAVHEDHKIMTLTSNNFLVEGQGCAFTKPGDSGRAIAMETGNSTIEIVGIITGGSDSRSRKDTSRTRNFTVCLLLSSGLEYLSKLYNIPAVLHISPDHMTEKIRRIEPGMVIFFKVPEQIKKLDFVLSDRILLLMEFYNFQEQSPQTLSQMTAFEKEMNDKVYTRARLEKISVDYLLPDQQCVFESLIACQFVFEVDYNKAEKHLKNAGRMVTSEQMFHPMRNFCKIACYASWMILETGCVALAEKMIQKGIKFMERHQCLESYPRECLGYQYYDYSRVFRAMGGEKNLIRAKELASKSLCHFKDNASAISEVDMLLILASSHYAILLLNCGEHFENHKDSISDDDLNNAEQVLKDISKLISIDGNTIETKSLKPPSVEDVYFCIAACDLNYRKKLIEDSCIITLVGIKNAKAMHLQKEQHILNSRLSILQKTMLQNNKKFF